MTIETLKDENLLLLECVSGSRAYGLETGDSDWDLKGVFFLKKADFYGLERASQVADAKNDQVYTELGRFVELLLRNNPNMLELLATPPAAIRYRHPVMDELRPELFLSRRCKESFAGYAISQIRKARGYNKKVVNPMEGARKTVTDFCYVVLGPQSQPLDDWLRDKGLRQEDCGLAAVPHARDLYALYVPRPGERLYGISSGPEANDVQRSAIPKGLTPAAHLAFSKDAYSVYCKDYKAYQDWLLARNETRYAGNQAHGKNYDAKNMMHTIRLLQVAEEILRDGRLNVRRPNRDELLAIKRGEFSYETLLEMAETLMERIETAAQHSPLPEAPDESRVNAALVRMREKLYH